MRRVRQAQVRPHQVRRGTPQRASVPHACPAAPRSMKKETKALVAQRQTQLMGAVRRIHFLLNARKEVRRALLPLTRVRAC